MVIQKCEKSKKWIFSKNCLTLFVSGREKNAFSCTLSVLAGPKHCKAGNTIKIGVSAEIVQNQKWHLSFKKVFFDMGEKVGFTNCVMLKKNRKMMKNSGLFLNMAKWCFLGLFFEVLILKRFVFGVSGMVSKVLKMFFFCFFSQFWGVFLGWLIVVHFGFGRFWCFCVSCVCLSLSLSLSCSFLVSFLSVFHFCLWFLLFLFVLFAFFFEVVLWFLLFCLLSCFVLNHNISFVFALHLLPSFCSCFLFCLLWFFGIFWFLGNQSKTFKKAEIEKTAKMKNAEKNGHFDKSS